ncbi:hypothetical protein IWX48DRAFT_428525 [Phyllosticta citricarpa]
MGRRRNGLLVLRKEGSLAIKVGLELGVWYVWQVRYARYGRRGENKIKSTKCAFWLLYACLSAGLLVHLTAPLHDCQIEILNGMMDGDVIEEEVSLTFVSMHSIFSLPLYSILLFYVYPMLSFHRTPKTPAHYIGEKRWQHLLPASAAW